MVTGPQLCRQNQTLPTPPELAQWLRAEHTLYRALLGSSVDLAVGRGTPCCLLGLLKARTLIIGCPHPMIPQGHTTLYACSGRAKPLSLS